MTNTQVSKLRKAFVNNSSANIKLSQTQLHKIGQSEAFLGRLLGPLLKTGFSLMGNILKLLDKGSLILLRLTAAASAIGASIHKKILGSCFMEDIMGLVMSLEDSGLLIKSVAETIKNETKK